MIVPASALMMVKQSLQRFAESRVNAPREQQEREFGELLLYLVRLAEKYDVDLIGSAVNQVGDRARRRLRVVNEVRSDDDRTRG